MFYGQCWKCGERWALGTASTCKCPDETPKRKWVGLTNKELADCWETIPELAMRKVEAKLKEKNHD
jgi:hypothetical protein